MSVAGVCCATAANVIGVLLLALLNFLFVLNWCVGALRVVSVETCHRNVWIMWKRAASVGLWLLDWAFHTEVVLKTYTGLNTLPTHPIVLVGRTCDAAGKPNRQTARSEISLQLGLLCFAQFAFVVHCFPRCRPEWLALNVVPEPVPSPPRVSVYWLLRGPARQLPFIGWTARWLEWANFLGCDRSGCDLLRYLFICVVHLRALRVAHYFFVFTCCCSGFEQGPPRGVCLLERLWYALC
jgi:hypothetical protein